MGKKVTPNDRVPKAMQATYDEVVGLTDAFCGNHLNAEYSELCRRMTSALARKRPSPLSSGKAQSWACGIVYALGRINFLFDTSQKPHLAASEVCALFGVSNQTASAKARVIENLLKLGPMDPRWCLSSLLEKNPLVWMFEVNGFLLDMRQAPLEIQEEAYRRGLIPFIPDDSE